MPQLRFAGHLSNVSRKCYRLSQLDRLPRSLIILLHFPHVVTEKSGNLRIDLSIQESDKIGIERYRGRGLKRENQRNGVTMTQHGMLFTDRQLVYRASTSSRTSDTHLNSYNRPTDQTDMSSRHFVHTKYERNEKSLK